MLCDLVLVRVVLHHEQLGLASPFRLLRAVHADINDAGELLRIGRDVVAKIKVAARRAHLLDDLDSPPAERDVRLPRPDRASVHRVEIDQARPEQHLGRPARASDIEPERVPVGADPGERALEREFLQFARHQLQQAILEFRRFVARIGRAQLVLDKEPEAYRLRARRVVLDGQLQVDEVFHDRPQRLNLEARRVGVEDQFRLRCVPAVFVEDVEEVAVAADAAGEPAAIGRAGRRRKIDERGAVRPFAFVVAGHHILDGDGEFKIPPGAGNAAADLRLGLPLPALARIGTPILVGHAGERIREPLEKPHLETLRKVVVGPELQLDVVVPDEAIEWMVDHIREAPPGFQPRVLRVDGSGVGDVEPLLVVPRVDLQLRLDRGEEDELGLRVVVPEPGERGGVLPFTGIHLAIDLGRPFHEGDAEDGGIDLGGLAIGGGSLLSGGDREK